MHWRSMARICANADFATRRELLERWHRASRPALTDLSELLDLKTKDELTAKWRDTRADAIEGMMLKRRSSAYLPGRREGPLVQVEARAADTRLRTDVCAARFRQTVVAVFRLHLWHMAPITGRRRTNWYRLARPTRAIQTRNSSELIAGFAPTRQTASGPYARSRRAWCWKLPLTPSITRAATSPAWPCGFPASIASAGTSRQLRPTRLETLLQLIV